MFIFIGSNNFMHDCSYLFSLIKKKYLITSTVNLQSTRRNVLCPRDTEFPVNVTIENPDRKQSSATMLKMLNAEVIRGECSSGIQNLI